MLSRQHRLLCRGLLATYALLALLKKAYEFLNVALVALSDQGSLVESFWGWIGFAACRCCLVQALLATMCLIVRQEEYGSKEQERYRVPLDSQRHHENKTYAQSDYLVPMHAGGIHDSCYCPRKKRRDHIWIVFFSENFPINWKDPHFSRVLGVFTALGGSRSTVDKASSCKIRLSPRLMSVSDSVKNILSLSLSLLRAFGQAAVPGPRTQTSASTEDTHKAMGLLSELLQFGNQVCSSSTPACLDDEETCMFGPPMGGASLMALI
jgi:hypothetical protein